MGVKGLWNVVQDVGHPIDLQTLQNKVIAIDLSIWINQSIKGIRGSNGETVEKAHVLSLFNRVCKLLFYKIKPVFVFDGNCPQLKRNTIAKRQDQRRKAIDKSVETSRKVVKNFLFSQLSSCDQLLPDIEFLPSLQSSLIQMPKNKDLEVFEELNELENNRQLIEDSDEIDSESEPNIAHKYTDFQDLDSIDVNSEEFNAFPPNIKFEIMTELKNRSKGYRNTGMFATNANDFSEQQMKKLLNKRSLQLKTEDIIRQLNGQHSDDIIEKMDKKDFHFESESTVGRLMSDENTRFIFLKKSQTIDPKSSCEENKTNKSGPNIAEDNSSNSSKVNDCNETSFLVISDSSDSEELITNSIINSEIIHKKCKNSKQIPIEISDESDVEEDIESKKKINSKTSDLFENNVKNNLNKDFNEFTKLKDIELSEDSNYDDFEEVFPKTTDSLDQIMSNTSDEEIEKMMSIQKSSEDIEPENNYSVVLDQINGNNEIIDTKKSNVFQVLIPNQVINIDSEEYSEKSKEYSHKTEEYSEKSIESEDYSEKTEEYSEKSKEYSHKTEEYSEKSKESEDYSEKTEEYSEKSKEYSHKTEEYSEKCRPSTSKSIPFESISRKELMESINDMNKQNRFANQTTTQMMSECMELLKLFGIPYVVAPEEAEAQCAALELLGLTDGTITDDSDILLFGAQTVYKNFFTDSKHIELFKAKDIETRFGFTRSSMICIAMLCGSDYTNGVDGVGAVTATEILSEFRGEGLQPLIKLKNWWESKRNSKDKRPENKIRSKLLKLNLKNWFPNDVIFDAYINPKVDKSKEKFVWGMPSLDRLRQYTNIQFEWTAEKTDQKLLPVLKKVNEKQTQMKIDNYFPIHVQPKDTSLVSKRMNKAIDKLRGIESLPQTSGTTKTMSALHQKVRNQRKRRQTKADNKSKAKPKSTQKRRLFSNSKIPQEFNLSESSEESD